MLLSLLLLLLLRRGDDRQLASKLAYHLVASLHLELRDAQPAPQRDGLDAAKPSVDPSSDYLVAAKVLLLLLQLLLLLVVPLEQELLLELLLVR